MKLKVLNLISGGDTGGAKTHIIALSKGLAEFVDTKVVCFIKDTFYEDLKAEGINIEYFEQKSRFDLSVIKKLEEEVKKEKYDLIHSHGARANFVSLLLKRRVDLPFVTTIHSDYELDFKDTFYKKIIFTNVNKFALKRFDYYISVSDTFKEMMVSRGFPADRNFVVYNGIDTEKERDFIPREDFLNNFSIDLPKGLIFGISARLDQVKDHMTFLRAVEVANKDFPGNTYLIAGEGHESENLRAYVKEKDLKNVYFIGYTTDIFSFYNAIDVNVLTSLSESFPYALLEGGLLKKPIISTEVGGIPKLVDEDTGFLFQPGDFKRLSEIIIHISKNKEIINKLGNNLREKIEEKFSNRAMALSHYRIYEKILKESKNKVLILGYYGFDNSGDDAILEAITTELKKIDEDLSLTVLSKSPSATERDYGIRALNRFSPLDVYKGMKLSDIFLFGGGTLLQDRTSTRSIRYYLATLKLADKLNKKTMAYANGMGPIDGEKNRRLTRKALEKIGLITLRDQDSYDFLKDLGVENKNVKVTQDPVFTIEGTDKARVEEIFRNEKIPTNVRLTGISLRPWDNDQATIGAIEELIEKTADSFLLIPMHQADDIKILERIRGDRVYLLKNEYDVRDLIGIMGSLDFLIGMRLHSLIYAAIARTPMLGLSYDPKVDGLLKDLEMKPAIGVDGIEGRILINEYEDLKARAGEFRDTLSRNAEEKIQTARENGRLFYDYLKG
ncbi:MAG: polysaccharide pyruvyl transferase CsaB [Tissierellia bacterium]|nr:polysaccharide pyruvyl transferase CsaB [Tissierellia bacterium]